MTITMDLPFSSKPRFERRSPSRYDGSQISLIVTAVGIFSWAIVSAVESNLSIIAVHLLFLVASIVVLRVMNLPDASRIFYASLAARSLFTILAWYTAYDLKRHFMLGTNEDSSRFWEASLMPLADSMQSFADPLFPALCHYAVALEKIFGNPAFLASCQLVTFAGSFFAVFSYTFIRDLYGEKVGRLAGYLMAFNPIAIAYSTALMRDAFIGMFGFMMLSALLRLVMKENALRKIGFFLIFVGAMVAANYLRTVSVLAFLGAGFLTLMTGTPFRKNILSLKARSIILIILMCGAGVAAESRFERVAGVFAFSIIAREGLEAGSEQLKQDGITGKISQKSPLLLAFLSPMALIQPIPFYTWKAPDRIGGPPALIDVLIGIGALCHQILFGLYIIAVRLWLRTRDSFGLSVGVVYTMVICASVLIGLGQIRMVMEQCYPLFLGGMSLAIVNVLGEQPKAIIRAIGIWFASIASLYLAYLGLSDPDFFALIVIGFFGSVIGLQALWRSAADPIPATVT